MKPPLSVFETLFFSYETAQSLGRFYKLACKQN